MKNCITEDSLEKIIKKEDYHFVGKKTTVCLLTLENGFEIIGFSACVDASNFDKEIGMKESYKNAFDKLWQLEGYKLQYNLQREKFNIKNDEIGKIEDFINLDE
jgi:hypothetical protein